MLMPIKKTSVDVEGSSRFKCSNESEFRTGFTHSPTLYATPMMIRRWWRRCRRAEGSYPHRLSGWTLLLYGRLSWDKLLLQNSPPRRSFKASRHWAFHNCVRKAKWHINFRRALRADCSYNVISRSEIKSCPEKRCEEEKQLLLSSQHETRFHQGVI